MDPNEFIDQPVRVDDDAPFRKLSGAVLVDDVWRLFLSGCSEPIELPSDALDRLEVLRQDGAASPARTLAGLWSQWMRSSTLDAKATVLATSPLQPHIHQNNAVYGAMLPQPQLRFLLADEAGTGKTVMAGMYLRETQRMGTVHRALVVAPAHLVSKWRQDFERFFGGGLKRITAQTVREGALGIAHDLWVVSLDLASRNPQVQDAIRPDRAGWDVVVIDEAHRLTPGTERHDVGRMLCTISPQVLLMTATPHRGKEWLFRSLMNLVDRDLFPPAEEGEDRAGRLLRPPKTHFLRRMKEDLVDRDGQTRLFTKRRARNLAVPLNADEAGFYGEALDLVERFFAYDAKPLARVVYGKRAASSLAALAETLKRRRNRMGEVLPAEAAWAVDPDEADEAAREEAEVVAAKSTAAKEEQQAIDALLARLEPVVADPESPVSKWPKVVAECLEINGVRPGTHEQAVVFSEYADTAGWLAERFRREGWTASTYTGRDSHSDRDAVRERFARRDFQVLVSTDAGNEGIDLQSAHVLVNWDIPWSLVTLEQRMGRIHRVGQTRDVELYNVIATDTREGDVLYRLLENFVTAANRLEGQMFDSLSAVAELADVDLPVALGRTYQPGGTQQVQGPDADELERIARRTREQEGHLCSQVDYAAAVAALHSETLERVNPRIVEAYLDRLTGSGHLEKSRSAAGPGIFNVEALRGSGITRALGGRQATVANGQTAVDRAREDDSDVDDVLILGPSKEAFQGLVEAVAHDTRDDLHRGATLVDPSSTTDYAVFCYDAEATDPRGRTRRWPFIVRVDEVGAQRLAWPSLANLEARDTAPRSPHPAWRSDAHEAASEVAEREAGRRRQALQDWLNASRREWERLPDTLADDIDDHDQRRQERQRLRSAVSERLNKLEQAVQTVGVGEPGLLGWAYVCGTATDDPDDTDSEHTAVRHVSQALRDGGWRVRDVQQDHVGYDLHAVRRHEQRLVEVKGVKGEASSEGIRLIGNEVLVAQQQRSAYWLYVVDRCADGQGRLYATIPDPVDVFADRIRNDTVARVPGSAIKQARDQAVPA